MRRLPVKLVMAVLAVGGGYWGAMTWAPRAEVVRPTVIATPAPAVVDASNAGAAVASTTVSGDGSGNDDPLILEVLDFMERRPNIVARLRQSVSVGDDQLAGEGVFWQQGVGNQRRTRWDLKTVVAGETAFVTQIYDGDAVWTDRKLPAGRKVTRVEVSTLRRDLTAPNGEQQGGAASDDGMPELLARGGISQLVASLHRSYSFGSRTSLQWGERRVWAVIGQWRPPQLDRYWTGLSTSDPSHWPSHLPHHVLLYIDEREKFPYLVEYRGAAQSALATSSDALYPARDPLARFEFIDVQIAAAMPADTFQFTPPENGAWTDITSRVIEELRPPPAPVVEAEGTARREGTWR